MNERDYYARLDKVPEPIKHIGLNNPLVSRLITEFCAGNIITLDEMLCQMIVGLSKGWDEHRKRIYELAASSTFPMFTPPKG